MESIKLFRDVAQEVLESKMLKSKATQVAARHHLTRLIKAFGSHPISNVIERVWVDYMVKEVKKRPRKFYDDRKYLKMVLIFAWKNRWIERVPELPIPDLPSNVGRELTPEELKRLLLHANPQIAFQIRIAYKMGFRLRELLHLQWDRFNFKSMTIKLRPEDTKTRRGREVPVTPDLQQQFWALYTLRNSIYVFPHRYDVAKPQHDNKSAWVALKKKCGIVARWHDLRHSCASSLLRKGVPEYVVRQYLGMGKRVLNDIYAHLSLDDLKDAAKVMNDGPKGQPYSFVAPPSVVRYPVSLS